MLHGYKAAVSIYKLEVRKMFNTYDKLAFVQANDTYVHSVCLINSILRNLLEYFENCQSKKKAILMMIRSERHGYGLHCHPTARSATLASGNNQPDKPTQTKTLSGEKSSSTDTHK